MIRVQIEEPLARIGALRKKGSEPFDNDHGSELIPDELYEKLCAAKEAWESAKYELREYRYKLEVESRKPGVEMLKSLLDTMDKDSPDYKNWEELYFQVEG